MPGIFVNDRAGVAAGVGAIVCRLYVNQFSKSGILDFKQILNSPQ
jgi:hypothetical protein